MRATLGSVNCVRAREKSGNDSTDKKMIVFMTTSDMTKSANVQIDHETCPPLMITSGLSDLISLIQKTCRAAVDNPINERFLSHMLIEIIT